MLSPNVALALTAAVVVYLFATADAPYAWKRDEPADWRAKRQSINYYAWRGPMFTEDFAGATGIPKTEGARGCVVPVQTSEEGWRHEYHNCAYRLGRPDGYRQCTNNNRCPPNDLKSVQMRSVMGDWFDPRDRISPWCHASGRA